MTRADARLETALWYKRLAETSNAAFLPLFFDEHRYLVLKGGGGSGKSIFAGRKVLERCVTEPGHRFLVCRKVGRTLRESCFKQLIGQLAEHYPESGYRVNHSDMLIRFRNGSEIIFTGLDDVEKLKSIYNITSIWIEEASELREADFNQLDIRLRGETRWYKQIILSFNPISITHWLKKRFFDKRDGRARVHESTYKDNRFLDEEQVRVLESFRDVDEYYYEVYCLGFWGTAGKSVFNAKALTARLEELAPPLRVGAYAYDTRERGLENVRFENAEDGFIRIYKEPEAGVPYVIGGDTAGEGSDSFTAQVLDNRTGEQVAVLKRAALDEDEYARQVWCLGMAYNAALVGVETNFSTYPVMELERLRYPKQYVRETVDDFTHRLKQSFGFATTPKTRPVILSELIRAVRDDPGLIRDRETIEEMLTFVRNEAYRPEAESGAHDDLVMALAIAHYIRPHQRYTATGPAAQTAVWTASQWEDYRNASPAERDMLVKKWGRPKT